MTRIDFYILPKTEASAGESAEKSAKERENFACRLAEKAVNNHRILIAVNNLQDAESLDSALWSFKPESFIPHQIISKNNSASKAQIDICFDDYCGDHHDVLINLTSERPSYFSQFKRLAEIVTQEPSSLKKSREHYAYYQQRGYPINHHKL